MKLENIHNRVNIPSLEELEAIKPRIVAEAQTIYDEWDPTTEEDMHFGGGICDEIASVILGILYETYNDIVADIGGFEGDDHAYVVIYGDQSMSDPIYSIDIPANTYETGGGYNWTKIDGVQFGPQHIIITSL